MLKEKYKDTYEMKFTSTKNNQLISIGKENQLRVSKQPVTSINITNTLVFIVNEKKHDLDLDFKKKWDRTYRDIHFLVKSKLSVSFLLEKVKEINLESSLISSLIEIMESDGHIKNESEFVFSALNLLSKFSEIQSSHGDKILSINRETGFLSLNIVNNKKANTVILDLIFSPNGNVSFFTYDEEDDVNDHGYSISGYMTPSKKYKSVKKINTVLNLIHQGEW